MTMAELLAHANIAIHVTAGSLALLLGLFQLVTRKGGVRHARVGGLFVTLTWIVVTTAAAGLVLFRFRAFLAVLTLLVAYWTFSGIRAVRIRDSGPTRIDAIVSLLALSAAALFVVFLPRVRFPWVPLIIYSTLATLTAVALYDLVRFAFPRRWYSSLWLYEHVVKIIGAHAAIVAAFSGTVLAAWQPYSQILPSAIWTALQIGFILSIRRARSSSDLSR
jgi:hypothetical protein